jgi:hypothetical protein
LYGLVEVHNILGAILRKTMSKVYTSLYAPLRSLSLDTVRMEPPVLHFLIWL